MFCPNCGSENADNSQFCGNCGFKFNQQKNNQNNMNQNNSFNNQANNAYYVQPTMQPNFNQNQNFGFNTNNMNIANNSTLTYNSIEDALVDVEEKVIATFGNNYIQSIAFDRTMKNFAFILTDKRIYFKGTGFLQDGNQIVTAQTEQILDLNDITATKFTVITNFNFKLFILGLLIAIVPSIINTINYSYGLMQSIGAFIFMGIIVMLIPVILFFVGRSTYFNIEYAGGSILANIKLFGIQSAHDFNRQIRRTKDALVKGSKK